MSKIGLLSMQRVNNYGSFWQAYCLKKMLQENGNIVEFIDIIPGTKETVSQSKKTFSFSKIKRIPYYIKQKQKSNVFKEYQMKVLECNDIPNYSDNYDAIIIGSDEVFNCIQKSSWGFSEQLFGSINNDNVNTYAASFGYTTYENVVERHYVNDIKKALNNLKHISVRDENSCSIIKKIDGRCPEKHFDPVVVGDLPLDKLPTIKENNKYILIYSYDFRFSDKKIIQQIRKLAKKNGYKIYSVGFYQDWCDKNIITDPKTLLSYFKKAEYIITDTFHGTIFSVRCHKQFITIIRDSNRQKLGDLLNRLNMIDRLFENGDELERLIDINIDYKSFELLREKERKNTEEYLYRCLNVSH